MKWLFVSLWVALLAPAQAKAPVLSAKDLAHPPAKVIRICCAFGSEVSVGRIPFVKKTDIMSLDDLGTHQYLGGPSEGNGIIYTQKGGFVDLGHLRDYADWTAYWYVLLTSKETSDVITLSLGTEGGPKMLTLKKSSIPSHVDRMELAARMAYDLSVWHEISTWFGASYIPMVPERFSSFSPEDLYSNLLGTRLGILALKSPLPYEEAITELLASTLESLMAVDEIEETFLAMEEVENLWWTREKAIPNKRLLLKRYMQNGSELVPWLLPADAQREAPYILDIPDDRLRHYYDLTIKLNARFPVAKIFPLKEDRVVSQNDFDDLILFIEAESVRLDAKYAKKTKP